MRAALVAVAVVLVVWARCLPLKLAPIDDYAHRYGGADSAGLAERLKSSPKYRDSDGAEHVFLGDIDSYYWLRLARNLIRTGSPCDAIVNGRCWDTLAKAPVGRPNRYSHSLHVFAIAGLHRLVTIFKPNYPIPATSFLVPVIVGALGVLPAFAIGFSLGGNLAGFAAALVSGLNPILLSRTISSDNDIWNVVLPLWMVWALMRAMAANGWGKRIAFASTAAAVAAVHAGAWDGWIFTYDVATLGLLATILMQVVDYFNATGSRAVWNSPDVRRSALVTAIFCVIGALAMTLVTSRSPAVALNPARQLSEFSAPGSSIRSIWPDVMTAELPENVTEMAPASLGGIADGLGGRFLFLVGCVGLIVIFAKAFRAPEAKEATRGIALIVAVWFLAALALSFRGPRFIMLMVPPFAISVGAALGMAYQWLTKAALRLLPGRAGLTGAIAFLAVALILVSPVRQGFAEARGYIPQMNRAWWDALSNIRDKSPADSIVDIWGGYGYWAEYISERRVSADGGSERSHLPYWQGKALMASSEELSVGLLRMLNCGSDATPEPAGRAGGYGKLRAYGLDQIAAADTVMALAGLDLADARAMLAQRGLADSARDDVLASTHCSPPPSYLVLSTSLIRVPGWRYAGEWDIHKADASADEALASAAGYRTGNWIPCFGQGGSELTCQVENGMDSALNAGAVLRSVIVHPADPAATLLRIRFASEVDGADRDEDDPPGVVVIATPTHLDEVRFPSSHYPNVAVLIDVTGHRVLIGPPDLIRSTFTELVFLGGRYSRLFKKVDDQLGYGGERVTTWEIEGPRPPVFTFASSWTPCTRRWADSSPDQRPDLQRQNGLLRLLAAP